ncbi:hypothetical protein HON36_05415 [Candidatus Parcubacteria bacterium]|jgi:competence protein ComGC|nr:hypothetical protein [Candidatus Parcubacteria bacterium]MBT7228430.1 hypothetical protein [Candidatus Parcubacteria bacterium]
MAEEKPQRRFGWIDVLLILVIIAILLSVSIVKFERNPSGVDSTAVSTEAVKQ